MYKIHWHRTMPPKPCKMLTKSARSPFRRKPSSIIHCKMVSSIRFVTVSQPLAALVRSSACRSSWRWVMG